MADTAASESSTYVNAIYVVQRASYIGNHHCGFMDPWSRSEKNSASTLEL